MNCLGRYVKEDLWEFRVSLRKCVVGIDLGLTIIFDGLILGKRDKGVSINSFLGDKFDNFDVAQYKQAQDKQDGSISKCKM